MIDPAVRQAIVDEEHLKLLPIMYWIQAGVTGFIGLYGLLYVFLGIMMAAIPASASDPGGSPAFVGLFFGGMGLAFLLGFGLFSLLNIMTGVWLRKRKHYVVCLIVAGLSCLSVPYGALTGVFKFMVLQRPSVKALFGTATGEELSQVLPAAPPSPETPTAAPQTRSQAPQSPPPPPPPNPTSEPETNA